MTDQTELKRLAEAFPSDLDWDSNTEPFFNGPSGESLGGGADGTYTVYGKPFRLEGEDYDYDGPTYVERCGVDFAKFMVSARKGVLALISENEVFEDGMRSLASTLGAGGYNAEALTATQLVEKVQWGVNHLANTSGRLADELRVERDQLRAENEALRKALAECTASFEGEMLQKYHGQKPENMHPVTRRDYDRDMAELAGYRAAMSKGEQP
jgi:hypothetical protein